MKESINCLDLQKMTEEKVTDKQVLAWCQKFLRGTWSNATVDQLRINPIS